MSFLGITRFFRHWVPNYTSLAKPLYAATKDTPTGPLSSETEVQKAFYNLHSALLSSSPLFLPNPNLPYHLYTDEKGGIAFGALIQPVGPEMLPVAFISKQLDPTAQGWFPCLCALAAAASLYADAKKLILDQPLSIVSPHRLAILLAFKFLSDLSDSRLQQFRLVFLDNPQVTLGCSSQINPLSSLPSLPTCPSGKDTGPHSCIEVLDTLTQLPPNLFPTPLQNPDLTLFVDGSSKRDPNGHQAAAYAVVTINDILEARLLLEGTTSQKAELIALTRALHLAMRKQVNIYADSKYAFLIAHSHSAIWRERGFLTTKGSPISNAALIAKLLEAISQPTQVAILLCKGHQTTQDTVSLGNNKAD